VPGPLAGTRVVEVACIGPGPFAGMLLADLGAEIVRIDCLHPQLAGPRTTRLPWSWVIPTVRAIRQGPAGAAARGVSWDVARDMAYRAATPLPIEYVPLSDALGRVLAQPLCALATVPVLACSAMDGYAVRGPSPWRVVSRARAGERSDPLEPGTACEIATGAPVPVGAVGVLPYEQASRHGELVDGRVAAGRHIRPAGEQCREGEQVLAAGAVLGPAALGLAAALGHDSLQVRTVPRVHALVTGDELVDRGVPVGARVRDSIGPMLPGLAAWAGGRFTGSARLADSAQLLTEALLGARGELVLVTGSSSRGPADHLRPVLDRLDAELLVDGVHCRPGHPQALARLPGGTLVVGLPGNPFAAFSAFLTLGLPALAALRARPLTQFTSVADRMSGRPGVTRLLPVRLEQGRPVQLRHGGSAMLRGLAEADALAIVAPDGATRLHALPAALGIG
jgi:molybdopterin molybdotransferase